MEFQTYNIVNERPRTIRALARQALQGRWTEAFVLLLVVTAIEQVPGTIINSIAREGSILGFIASIYSLLIAGPLAMGVAYYFIKLFRQRNGGLDDLKYGFGYAQKAIVLHLNIIIRVFLWALLFIVPGIIAGIRYSMANYILIPWLIDEIFDRDSALVVTAGFVGVYAVFFYYQVGVTWHLL